ncbi:hypothetical protein PC41400_05940 [Paenibacillus chitinolyticus]|uniref:Uncharacterized protein n=1 Tax=Paenibacillus chitinolyticus TaxID=79263 RepID=A0A410WS42_9BACL|nr:hypothetical protein [Paenibacillus chitinolyticus]MCY9589001.1 hypothetical protein [Paenibacillus chitinolyticus]MCY9595455.1 hypothetical protein [Paenibacillus chitinolyticus]QAV17228.1 hypothetical protein PC41400_05940 [Paenibacillus chitinolyticus]
MKLKLRKADEMERYQTDKSAKIAFIFYTGALLAWGLYNFFSTGKTGGEFTILLVGNAIFLWSRVVYRRKMQ